MRVLLPALFVVGILPARPAVFADDRMQKYLGACRQFEKLRSATWELRDTVDEARFPSDPVKRKALFDQARRKLRAAHAAIAWMQDAVALLEKDPSWTESARLFRDRLKDYSRQVKQAVSQLSKADSPAKPTAPDPPAPHRPGTAPPKPDPPRTAGAPARKPPPHVSLETAVVQWELRELNDEMLLWEAFHDRELLGVRLRDRLHVAFKKHGSRNPDHFATEWGLQVGMRTTGALSMYGLWQPLGDAITDFRSDLERTQKLPPQHDAYLNYLRAAMKLWRKDIRQKRNLKLGLIDVVGQMGAAALSDDPPPYKRYHERSRWAEAIYARINRKLPITIRGYDDWLETQEDLAGQLGRLNVRQDESTLSRDDTLALINEVKKALKARGVPTRWLDDLAQDPPAVCIDRKFVDGWKAGALYDDLTNTVTLRDPVNTARPTPRNLAVLAHELFHAWYDTVPAWYQLWLSDNQNETVARFVQSRLRGDPLHEAIDKSVGYGTTFGGTAAESLTGIAKVANYWDDGNLVGGFANDQDRDGWNRLKTMRFPGCENDFRRLEADIENLRKR